MFGEKLCMHHAAQVQLGRKWAQVGRVGQFGTAGT